MEIKRVLVSAVVILGLVFPIAPSYSADSSTYHLEVKVESDSSSYDRGLFQHWIDSDKNGCDTRKEVLLRQSTVTIKPASGCRFTKGRWVSAFDGRVITNPSQLDIDHFVPLKEAWESGASQWTDARRRAFANDLSFRPSLIAVTASSNRSKGDRDPAEWLPSAKSFHCQYAGRWIQVKYRWQLSIDESELKALRSALGTCTKGESFQLPDPVPFEDSPQPSSTATPTPIPTPSPTSTSSPSPTSASSLLAGKGWTLEVSGPSEIERGEKFSLSLRLFDIDKKPLANKVISYSGWYTSGKSSPTDSSGTAIVEITPLTAWVGDLSLNFNSDFASKAFTVRIKLAQTTPAPSPSPSDSSAPSYRLVTPGAFCAKSEEGLTGVSSSGVLYTCKTSPTEDRLRWRR